MIRKNLNFLAYTACLEDSTFVIELFSPHDFILQQGKEGKSIYIIKSGVAKCYMTDESGEDFVQEFFGEGEIFGEIESIGGNLSFCNIEAITAVEVYKITTENFLALLEADFLFNGLIMKNLASKNSLQSHKACISSNPYY